MKTIKEKAEEYGQTMLTDWGVVSTERVEGFEAGANYVLECIEESIKNSPAGYGLIYYIIEQLKK